MNGAPELRTLLAGLAAGLVLVSIVGALLARRAPASATVANLTARLRSWWVMTGVLGVAFVIGHGAVIVLFALLSFTALREFFTLTRRSRADHDALVASFFLILPIQYLSIGLNWYGFYAIFVPVYAFLGLPILSVLRLSTDDFLTRISETQWALMISVYCVSHVPALLFLDIPGFEGRNILLIAFLILTVQGSDVLRYLWGTLAGRHRIAPGVSPSKTVAGCVGGTLSASLLGAGLWWLTPFAPWQALLMALTATTLGLGGSLVMSAIKRDRGVEDWGHATAGPGGILDRLDSVIFAAPVFFHLTRFFWETL